jgi:hypothetical protein
MAGLKKTKNLENEKNTIYVADFGLWQIIAKSNKPKAAKFQEYLYEVVLPSIRKHGFYSAQPTLIPNTCKIISPYNQESIARFMNKNCVYIIMVCYDLECNEVYKFYIYIYLNIKL